MYKEKNFDEEIDRLVTQVENQYLPDAHFELMLGIGVVYENAPKGVAYSAPYDKIGKKAWKIFRYELHSLLCEGTVPKEMANQITSGDIRNLAIGIVCAFTAQYHVSLGIAVPLTGLVLRTGVLSFCQQNPKKPKQTIAELLKQFHKK